MPDYEKWLRLLLRLVGGVMVTALFAIVLPTSWMASMHGLLGLGTFPESPLVEYLTRSISALYAIHGGVLLLASADLHRYSTLIKYIGCVGAFFGGIVTVIDLYAGMPLLWTLAEGPPVILTNGLILFLSKQVDARP